jgi:arginine:agmatine antiporter
MTTTKKIGPFLAALLVAGNMIGSGVYLLPATLASVGSSSVLSWLAATAGGLVLAGAFALLAMLRPTLNGIATYAGDGLGRPFGFASSMAYWVSSWVGNVAIALAVVGYLAVFVPGLKGPVPTTAATIGAIWLLAGANLLGPRLVARLSGLTLLIGLMPILAVIVLGAMDFDPQVFTGSWNPSGKPLAEIIPASVVPVFWAFLGFESANVAAAAVRDPQRDIPVAALGGVALAAVVYMAATVAIMGIIPAGELATSTAPFADAVTRLAGPTVGAAVAVCALVKAIGTLGGWILVAAETNRATAAEGFLPRAISEVEPGRTPVRDILVTTALMTGAAVLSASPTLGEQFNVLINVSTVLFMVVYGLCALALVRFAGAIQRPGPRLGARLLALAGALFSIWAIWSSDPDLLKVTGVVLLATTPLWAISALTNRRAAATA